MSICFALPLSFMATPVGAMDQGAPAAADDVFGAARGMAVVLSAAATVHTVGCPILRRAMLETSGDVRTPPSTENLLFITKPDTCRLAHRDPGCFDGATVP